jgi:anti-sigma factor RsiW
MKCEWIRVAYRILPLPAWKAFLLDRHIDRCPRCQAQALDDAAILSLGMTPARLQNEPPLRPFAPEAGRSSGFRPAWRYAFGFFLAAAILGGAFAIWRGVSDAALPRGIVTVAETEEDARVFAVLEARVGGEPARPIVFKPGPSGMTIVWFEKTEEMNYGDPK